MDGTESYLTVIGSNLLDPIAALLDRLDAIDSRGPNQVQASVRENGYAVSIILLAAVMLESLLGRVQWILQQNMPQKGKTEKPKRDRRILDFIETNYPTFYTTMLEIIVVRDVIAHGHLWEARIVDNDTEGLRLISASIVDGYGDEKFRKVIDSQTRLTKVLRLNLFPTRICRADALTVLSHICGFLKHLEMENRAFVYLSPQPLKYRNRVMQFEEFVRFLPPACPQQEDDNRA